MVDFAFLDSGTGGIPYMLSLKKKNPDMRCVYLGDTLHFPYGEKSPAQVTECAASVIKRIVETWNPRALVIACNTISVTALGELRKLFPELPVVGTVPAIKLAASVSKKRRIGLLATNATVRHPYCTKLIEEFASDCKVFSRGDPDLIEFIEHRLFTSSEEERHEAILPAVNYFLSCDCDCIILGCTHFTHIAEDVQKAAGSSVAVVDSRDGVANQALRVIKKRADCVCKENCAVPPDMSFFVTECRSPELAKEYEYLCKNFNIPWGGEF